MTDAAIDTRDLAKAWGRTVALEALTMRVERGEVFGFLGPNGAGKTTAVKLLLGLARPTGGGGTVLGAPLGDRETRARIGYLPELFRYQPWLRAREVLALHCDLARIPGAARGAEIEAALATVNLAERGNDLVGTFSKGMQQRLGLGVALLGSPDLVVLDEPTSALDPVGRTEVRSIVRAVADRGATVFLNSHLLGEVERVCDRVAIVDRGRVVAAGRPDELGAEEGVRVVVAAASGGPRPAGGADAVDVAAAAAEVAARFGPVAVDGDALRVGCPPGSVPDLVAALVAAGVRLAEVTPVRSSLEDRFLEIVAADR
ncbi:MAG TPA: ABC transporter ATP-binding protein [Candidatus Limnocylindrales bacterium]|nr:ABC transporter ATP-binding protein [Candidatus Limnocylindrales bacterium]